MASFAKPITRARADALLAGVLERAAAYDATTTSLSRIPRSGCSPPTSTRRWAGTDIDLVLVETIDRSPATGDPQALLDYSNRSARTTS